MLGRRLVHVLAMDHDVVAVTNEMDLDVSAEESIRKAKYDLTGVEATAKLLDDVSPDVIVNCAAMTDVDGCETNPVLARKVNCGIVESIVGLMDRQNTYFVQISTDYLFDGKSGPYSEEAETNPINVYGKTKLEAEATVASFAAKYIIIRTSALYDSMNSKRANLFSSLYAPLSQRKTVKAASDLYCNPIWTLNLARAISEAIDLNLHGILNIAGDEYLTRYEFACKLAKSFGFSTDLVKPVNLADLKRSAPRPLKAGVDVAKARMILKTELLAPKQVFSHPEFSPIVEKTS